MYLTLKRHHETGRKISKSSAVSPRLLLLITTWSILLNSVQCKQEVTTKPPPNKVVLMSMDGFRYDYLNKTHLPNFDKLIASGVKVPYVNNTFATWTFPCHYTIVTGLFEESHGIVGNHMYDPVFNASFNLRDGSKEQKWWELGEPIWTTAVKAGLKTGVYFWPGSEVKHGGIFPTKNKPYNQSTPFKDRVDVVVSDWLAKEDFSLALIYFHEPDYTGHHHGPDSPELIDTLKMMDGTLGYFLQKLKEENLTEKVDFILTSDHGMTNIDEHKKTIVLRDYVNDTLLHSVVTHGAVAHLRPQPGMENLLVDALSGIDHAQAYHKRDIPDHYFYKHHRRVMPVVLIAELGWTIRETKNTGDIQFGDHGYSSDRLDMRPIMIASGPSFKSGGEEIAAIKSVDIYPLMCQLLNLEPAPNNGSLTRAKSFLDPAKHNPNNNNAANALISNHFNTICQTILLFILPTSFKMYIYHK